MESDPDDSFRRVQRTVVERGSAVSDHDEVVCEEPLEIRIGGVPIAVVMRTPGHDLELVRGFLVSEGIVAGARAKRDIVSIRHCSTTVTPEAEDNVVLVVLDHGIELDLGRLRRNLFASSSCGICGKATIENAMTAPERVASSRLVPEQPRLTADHFYGLIPSLRRGQAVFDRTGGLHAAGIFDPKGAAAAIREDVGRHNAVDKVIGCAVEAGADLSRLTLAVSGRVSYEITQKAFAAGIPVVAGVSAPTSLAVEMARATGMTLVGFLRGQKMSVYADAGRLLPR